MNQNYEYELVLNERKKVSNAIENLKENEKVKKYLELCEAQEVLISKENELYSELLHNKNRKALIKEFQNMCYDYDIVI